MAFCFPEFILDSGGRVVQRGKICQDMRGRSEVAPVNYLKDFRVSCRKQRCWWVLACLQTLLHAMSSSASSLTLTTVGCRLRDVGSCTEAVCSHRPLHTFSLLSPNSIAGGAWLLDFPLHSDLPTCRCVRQPDY